MGVYVCRYVWGVFSPPPSLDFIIGFDGWLTLRFTTTTPPPPSTPWKRIMSIGQVYPSIACPSSPPEDLKPRVVKAHEETRKLQATYPPPPQPPAVDILSAHWSQQPPRLQTRVSTPQDLRRAVRAALRFDGSAHPASLPFSGNFLVDRGFAAARGARPLLDGVHALVPAQSAAQKASCGVIAQQLVRIIAEADGFTYTRQGAGSPLQGSRTVTGWYFHYVCDASRERLPS